MISRKKSPSLRAPKGRSNPVFEIASSLPLVAPRNDRWKVLVCTIVILISFAGVSYARTSAESVTEVEKLFLEAKYDRVVAESDKLIDAGAFGREELNYLKGLSLIQLDRCKEARQTFEYLVDRYPRGKRAFDGYIGIGDSYFRENKFNEAVVAYNEALKKFPDHKNSSVVYYKMGTSYQRLGVSDKANEYFSKVKEAAPLSFESRMISKETYAQPQVSNPEQAKPKETEEPSSGDYYVQAGYFKTKVNAEKLNDKLLKKGYESSVATLLKYNQTFYRVRVGHFKSRSEADVMARKLKKAGYLTKVCQ